MRPQLRARLQHVAALGGANVAAMALSLLTLPIVSRLYDPVDYGSFTVVATIGALVAPLSSLAYQEAIILAPSRTAAANVAGVCLTSAGLIAVLTACGLWLFTPSLTVWLNFTGEPGLLLVAALNALLSGAAGPLANLANREQSYRLIAISRLGSAAVIAAVSITLGSLHWGAAGLVAATVAGACTTLGLLIAGVWPSWSSSMRGISLRGMREQARVHSNFPRFTLPTHLINAVTDSLPRTLLAGMFGEAALGLFMRSSSLLALPGQVLGTPLAEVFRRDLSKLTHENGDPAGYFRRTAAQLAAIALLGAVVTLACAPWLFPLLLGPKWVGAGEFAQLLVPMYALRLVNAPLSFVVFLVRQHKFDLLMTVLLLPTSLGSMMIAFHLFHTTSSVLATYSAVYTATAAFMLYKNFQFAGQLHLVPNEIQSRHA